MSKKRGNKKNLDVDDDFEEKKLSNDTSEITSKSKVKNFKKKGKVHVEVSDGDDGDVKKSQISDEEEELKPVKKSQKKGSLLVIMIKVDDT